MESFLFAISLSGMTSDSSLDYSADFCWLSVCSSARGALRSKILSTNDLEEPNEFLSFSPARYILGDGPSEAAFGVKTSKQQSNGNFEYGTSITAKDLRRGAVH